MIEYAKISDEAREAYFEYRAIGGAMSARDFLAGWNAAKDYYIPKALPMKTFCFRLFGMAFVILGSVAIEMIALHHYKFL